MTNEIQRQKEKAGSEIRCQGWHLGLKIEIGI